MNHNAKSFKTRSKAPWSVDRYGRLIAGISVLMFSLLSVLHHPFWIVCTLFSSANLILTSLTDVCLVRNFLLRLGAKEREDLFHPGGSIRNDDFAREK